MAGRTIHYAVLAVLVQCASACSGPAPSPDTQPQNAVVSASPSAAPASGASAPVEDGKLVVVFGDSLFAGYGLAQDQGLAPALERALTAQGVKTRVFNAGVSGDTSAAGLQRLAFVLDGLEHKPDLVIVGLGANDMLRGLSPQATRANLDAILTTLHARKIDAVLTGMFAAPNLGPDYAAAFNPIYPDLAKKHGIALYPFFLDGVVGNRDLLLPDGMHPNDRGVETIVGRLSPIVKDALTG